MKTNILEGVSSTLKETVSFISKKFDEIELDKKWKDSTKNGVQNSMSSLSEKTVTLVKVLDARQQ